VITLAQQFRFNEKFLSLLGGDFDAAAWTWRPAGASGNTAHWLLGHLLDTRFQLLERLGVPVTTEPWQSEFRMGSKPSSELPGPTPQELVTRFGAAGEALQHTLETLSDAELAADWGKKVPNGGTSVLDAMRFYHFHETYHLGQIGLLRRQMGRPGII
jgi:uncharacterized damage-inducible protein DinB